MDIIKSKLEVFDLLCLRIISLYSKLLSLANSEVGTTCKISHQFTTLSSHAIRTGSQDIAFFMSFDL